MKGKDITVSVWSLIFNSSLLRLTLWKLSLAHQKPFNFNALQFATPAMEVNQSQEHSRQLVEDVVAVASRHCVRVRLLFNRCAACATELVLSFAILVSHVRAKVPFTLLPEKALQFPREWTMQVICEHLRKGTQELLAHPEISSSK